MRKDWLKSIANLGDLLAAVLGLAVLLTTFNLSKFVAGELPLPKILLAGGIIAAFSGMVLVLVALIQRVQKRSAANLKKELQRAFWDALDTSPFNPDFRRGDRG